MFAFVFEHSRDGDAADMMGRPTPAGRTRDLLREGHEPTDRQTDSSRSDKK